MWSQPINITESGYDSETHPIHPGFPVFLACTFLAGFLVERLLGIRIFNFVMISITTLFCLSIGGLITSFQLMKDQVLLAAAEERGLSIPPIVFVTAFDQHAVEAFHWSARDYLLKPVERDRLLESLERIGQRLLPAGDLGPLWQALQAVRKAELPERFTVLHRGRLRVFAWDEVSHLVTENRLLFVCTAEGRFALDRTLDELEKALAPGFLRCHRGAMVAFARIRELLTEPGGTGEVRLDTGDRVSVSRDRMAELRRRLGA